jgi:hypothetical protein
MSVEKRYMLAFRWVLVVLFEFYSRTLRLAWLIFVPFSAMGAGSEGCANFGEPGMYRYPLSQILGRQGEMEGGGCVLYLRLALLR